MVVGAAAGVVAAGARERESYVRTLLLKYAPVYFRLRLVATCFRSLGFFFHPVFSRLPSVGLAWIAPTWCHLKCSRERETVRKGARERERETEENNVNDSIDSTPTSHP